MGINSLLPKYPSFHPVPVTSIFGTIIPLLADTNNWVVLVLSSTLNILVASVAIHEV